MTPLVAIIVFILLMASAGYVAVKLRFALHHFKMERFVSGPALLRDLPSVSVCIPARNETHAMTDCLERVVSSTYPKLEIIVLDDSSVDDTSVLIKSFAHAGVRFVEGSDLPAGWLGKNHALEGLLREASGSLILFLDVDTLISPDTIEQLVAYKQAEGAAMVSVLPTRRSSLRFSTLLGSLRYFWEVILHRRGNPAVASSAWMIDRTLLLNTFGGFEPLKSAVQPEAIIASSLAQKSQYRFIVSTPLLGVSFEKKWRAQIDTSVRLLFPVLGSHIFTALTLTLLLTLLSLLPVIAIIAFINGWIYIALLAGLVLVTYVVLYALYLSYIERRSWLFGALLWPIVITQELAILVTSTIAHLTRTVTWKGRPISLK